MTESPKPLGMSDFFALEAGEYLERLDGMLAKGDSPSADEIVRLARALRGSALMASQPAIARAAAGLEVLARAVREGRRAWDPQTQQLALRAVDDMKIFVRRAGSWTDADTAKAEALAVELEQVAGRPSAQIRAVEALGLEAGARAFVAREGAAIAGALERAAQALRANPRTHDPLQHVMRALQPLRGLAALTDLPPLPDLLEGIERAIGELSRSGIEPPANVADLFQGAAGAIARAAREVAERGRPDPEGPDFRQFAGLLVKFMESEPDAVSIGSLYYSDSGPHIVSRGVPAARPSTLGKLELVSHGEHLRQAADSLERAPSAAPGVPGVKAAPAPRHEPAMPETPDLVGSWAAYQRLSEAGIGSASLAELIAGVESAPAAPTPGSPLAAAAAPATVDVRALLYRGDRALQRAQELRAAAKRASGDELRALVDEVCDLVALALEPSP